MDNKTEILQIQGLSEAEAVFLLKQNGFNELPSQKKRSGFYMLFKIMSEPMIILLIGAGVIYLFMGDIKDALLLVFSVIIVIAITFYQERKTEKTLEALKSLSSPRALVIRDGVHKKIAGRDVVVGDILIIHEGDRVPADSVVISCENLSLDESLLTGEPIPVRKIEWDEKMEITRPGGDDLPFIYSGSLVTSGRGVARVIYTGLNTEIGKIGKSLESIKDEDTLLHKETKKIVITVAIIGIILCAFVVAYYFMVKGNLVNGLLAGLTLSMAILPEEFPLVLIIFMTLGAWRISKRNVLTRRSAAIEMLGAATVLCSDKTGTITMNKMELSVLYTNGKFYELNDSTNTELPDEFKNLLEYGVLSSQKDLFDPLEKELYKIGNLYLKDLKSSNPDWSIVKEYPLSKELLALSHIWKDKNDNKLILASKGAPEAILKLCHADINFKNEILQKIKEMSDKGLRVLGVAKGITTLENLPENQTDFEFEFVGLLGFIDPVRDTVPSAVKESYMAGMRVIMITGDYPGTAQFIGKQIGIKNTDEYLTGVDLEKMDPALLKEKIKTVNIFARVFPEQKLLIINALKENDEIVAMTGDGVNDAPALKTAHIGVAMGQRGTDVAREASSLVLLDDDFSSIVSAVRLGRRIYNNLKRAMGYLLAVHVPIAGMSVLPLVFNLPIVLFPAHVAFLELIIDPACSTVFEAEKEDAEIMNRPPRNLHQSMFNFKTVMVSVMQGLGILLVTFALYYFVIKNGRSELEARSFAFSTLVLSNLMLIIINLSWVDNIYKIITSGNKVLYMVFIGALLSLMAVLYIPFMADLFHMAPLYFSDFILIGASVVLSMMWFEILKLFHINLLK
ncbi:MAG: cation-translocating P-type ATPase [Candidatus Pacebacteria bacterium]|nr:cation-translocating P-type ATPase [Candidatus Paceibacterota bacterium]